MEHETSCIIVNGHKIHCVAKIIGNDLFRYFVEHYEFPFCSVDIPDEQNQLFARTIGETILLNENFTHEYVVRWAIDIIRNKDCEYYKMVFGEDA